MLKSVPSAGDAASRYSPEEWSIRVDLAAAYRLVAHFHWDDLVFTHITARVPGAEHHFLINPYGMMFDEITASSLVKIDMQGNKVGESPWPINPAGFTIHSAIHGARHDNECVALREDEKPRLVADMGKKNYLMLRNHGLLTVGRSVAEAFQLMYTFEATCAIQVRAQAGGGELIPIQQSIIDTAMEQARMVTNNQGPHMLVWPGLLRRLDRIDPSYKT